MDDPPSNSELGVQLSTTTAAPAAAWHVLGMLLSHGRPTELSDLASSFESFLPTADFVRFLCSVPNSPIRIAENHSVTISQVGVAAIAQFVVNSDVIMRCLNMTQFVPRAFPNARSYDIVWTYCRKRKRSESKVGDLPSTKKRCYSRGCDEEQSLNQMLTTMPGEIQNAPTQGIEISSSASSFSAYKCWEPKRSIMECIYNRMEGAFLSKDELDYLQKEICNPNFFFQGKFPDIQRSAVEEMVNTFSRPKIPLLEHKMINYSGSSIGNIDLVNIVNCDGVCTLTGLEVDEANISQTENKTLLQMCESLDEDDNRKGNEILLHDFGRCKARKENHQAKIICTDAADTTPNNVGLHEIAPRKGSLQSPGEMLKRGTKPDKNDRRKTISPSVESCESLPSKRLEKLRRDEDQNTSQQKVKCNSDQHSNAREKEASIENRKKYHNEQKSFPNFELYIAEQEEGSGGYGTVYRARRKADGVPFAIKCPHPNANLNYVNNELKMLERLGGKDFVIKYEGSLKTGSNDCLVLQHVEHDRPEILKKEINVIQLQWYGYCLFKALAGLHKQGIVHRDVKPGNFLFSRKVNKGYLIDFNLALDLSKKHGTTAYNSKARRSQNGHSPIFHTKPQASEKSKKLLNARLPDAVHKNTGKVSKSALRPVDVKKRVGKATPVTDTSSKNSIKTQGADVSGITSARDVTSSRIPSAERLKGPLPQLVQSRGREELVRMLQEAIHGGNHKSANAPTSKRKRVAAPPGHDSKCFYPTPMPLYANGLAIGSTGLLNGKADGKRKRDGPCAGTKGFKAPEVLFRSLHQGLKTDIWSAGVTLLYLIIGRTPFVGDTDQNIKEIAKLRGSEDLWEVAKIHDHESSLPTDLLDIKYLTPVKLQDWCAHNTRRLDFLDAIPRSLYDLVDKCLTVNPRQRISADDALRHEFFAPCHEALKKQRQQDTVHS